MTLGERIAAARNKAGLTQLQLAQELGLPLFQVADWERGPPSPLWSRWPPCAGSWT